MKRSSGPRTASNLSESIHQQLNMYAIVAGAAGVGMLALAQPAEARIVYTPANIQIPQNFLPVPIDLNHDGMADFSMTNLYIFSTRGLPSLGALDVKPAQRAQAHQANEIWEVNSSGGDCAAALPKGKPVGPKGAFQRDPVYGLLMAEFNFVKSSCPWVKVKQAFLGLKFWIKGQPHFGWARVKLSHQAFSISATLTGYAYETIPNKAIITGKTKGPADEWDQEDFGPGASLTNPIPGTPQPASLGMLAMGSPGLSIWRRKESVGATQ
jgi:hypothetical protein